MAERISLNGNDWQFKDFYGEDWRWRGSHKPGTRDLRGWRNGSVPGCPADELLKLGEIPDPYIDRNSLLIEWIPERTWVYKKTFHAPAQQAGQRVFLRFEGVDYEAEFFLNGERLGDHSGMYTPVEFEIGGLLKEGENLVAVVIEPAPCEQPQVGRTSRVRTHKSRMTYWWDFCPRMVHQGIWDDVYLEIGGPHRITDVFVRPRLSADRSEAAVSVETEIDAAGAGIVEVTVDILLDGRVLASHTSSRDLQTGSNRVLSPLVVREPHLWQPNGLGDQPLYTAELKVHPLTRGEAETRSVSFGIRSLELAPNENSDPEALPYTFVMNGRKMYVKGWNWVPVDVMYGVPRPEKLERLIELARRANVNMLRVWGGGLIETEAFYNLCDRKGILVWQEFIQSSSGIDNKPPESPEVIAMLVEEAEEIIPRKRNHPSLAVWCGGNELQVEPDKPADDSHPNLNALKGVVNRLDPDRLWFATSPTGKVFSNDLQTIAREPQSLHDVHGPWEYQGAVKQYELFNRGTSLFHSEFGVEGITNRKTLDATITGEQQAPVSLDNPTWFHRGAWWVKRKCWDETFGELTEIDPLIRATQFLQFEGLRYALEANRRRKFHNSGSLPWQFNEPYPMAACTSAVDYFARPKPAYYGVRQAYEPVHVSAKYPALVWGGKETFEAEVWGCNSGEEIKGRLGYRLVSRSGKTELDGSGEVVLPANGAKPLAEVSFAFTQARSEGEIFFLDLKLSSAGGEELSRNRCVFSRADNLAPLLSQPATDLQVEPEFAADRWKLAVTNTGSTAAMFVWLEDESDVHTVSQAYFSDNYFCLFPGETRLVEVEWAGKHAAGQVVEIFGWNTPRYRVSP